MGSSDDPEVGSALRLALKEGAVGTGPFAQPRVGLHKRHNARRSAPIATVVVSARDAGCLGRLDEFPRAWEHRRAHRNPKRTGAVVRRRIDRYLVAWRESLALAEVGQHIGVAPPGS